jgi:hypothetical protein
LSRSSTFADTISYRLWPDCWPTKQVPWFPPRCCTNIPFRSSHLQLYGVQVSHCFHSRSSEYDTLIRNTSKMPKTAVFTTITPLPAGITRKSVIDMYRDHLAMIDLNPLVVERYKCKPPNYAPTSEYYATWYTIKGTYFSTRLVHRVYLLITSRQSLVPAWRSGNRISLLSRCLA